MSGAVRSAPTSAPVQNPGFLISGGSAPRTIRPSRDDGGPQTSDRRPRSASYYFFFDEHLLRGTLPPARRASESPIAIACFRLVTFLPERPLFNVPPFRSCIAFSTFWDAFLPYRAIVTSFVFPGVSSGFLELPVAFDELEVESEQVDPPSPVGPGEMNVVAADEGAALRGAGDAFPVVVRDPVAKRGGATAVDVDLEVAELMVNLVDRLETAFPGGDDFDRLHVQRLAARQRSHVEDDHVGQTRLDARPVPPVGRHEEAHDHVLDFLALAERNRARHSPSLCKRGTGRLLLSTR